MSSAKSALVAVGGPACDLAVRPITGHGGCRFVAVLRARAGDQHDRGVSHARARLRHRDGTGQPDARWRRERDVFRRVWRTRWRRVARRRGRPRAGRRIARQSLEHDALRRHDGAEQPSLRIGARTQENAGDRDRGRVGGDAAHGGGHGRAVAEEEGHRRIVAADGACASKYELDREAGEVHERDRAVRHRDTLSGEWRRRRRVERLRGAAVPFDGDLESLRGAIAARTTPHHGHHVLGHRRRIGLHLLPHLLLRRAHAQHPFGAPRSDRRPLDGERVDTDTHDEDGARLALRERRGGVNGEREEKSAQSDADAHRPASRFQVRYE